MITLNPAIRDQVKTMRGMSPQVAGTLTEMIVKSSSFGSAISPGTKTEMDRARRIFSQCRPDVVMLKYWLSVTEFLKLYYQGEITEYIEGDDLGTTVVLSGAVILASILAETTSPLRLAKITGMPVYFADCVISNMEFQNLL